MLIDLLRLPFDPRGRVGRAAYIGVQLTAAALNYALTWNVKHNPSVAGIGALDGAGQQRINATGLLGAVLLYVSFAVSMKRLRDMGRSVGWLAPVFGPGVAMAGLLWAMVMVGRSGGVGALTPFLPLFDVLMALAPAMPVITIAVYVAMYGFKIWLAATPSRDGRPPSFSDGVATGSSPAPARMTEAPASPRAAAPRAQGFGRRAA
jgi:uncharacterized membrane protein YhaH (DUF805 family)